MKISIKGFISPKEAELFYDCADRYAINQEHNKFAISDGVSKSFFPKVWAEALVNNWVENLAGKSEKESTCAALGQFRDQSFEIRVLMKR